MKRLTILITSPMDEVGRKVLAELLAPEFLVRVITCEPSRLPEPIREQVEIIPGSIDDPVALYRALEGVDALFWCEPGETTVHGHYERFALAACQAIRKAGTPRVVTISCLQATEDILNQSGASIRHLRCASLAHHDVVADAALRWLVRRDWNGIESVTLDSAGELFVDGEALCVTA
jgi:uncharacterized protein YbjT (DUF2867 family)